MGEIQVLPAQVIDQIAAGEVVERPASVVKELVENALDAGARSITVSFEGGGKSSIRVVDDGGGMSPGDAEVALARHATSKIRSIDDLIGLPTKGFRGEALASIAAVSKLSITTRRSGDMGGFFLLAEGGSVIEREPAGAPVGTTVAVDELFYNVPARRKFLKGDATEAGHIKDIVSRLALAHPDVSFRVKRDGRQILAAPSHRSALERVRSIIGSKASRDLSEVVGEEGDVRVRAYLAPPDLAQSTSRGLQLFVGERPVRDRGMLHAVTMGYGELLPRGRYPIAVVFVDVADADVDINVHPQKSEVRFASAQRVYTAVRRTVARGAAEATWLGTGGSHGAGSVALRSWTPTHGGGLQAAELSQSYARVAAKRVLAPWANAGHLATRKPLPAAPVPAPTAAAGTEPTARAAEVSAGGDFFSRLRFIGQLDRTYLLCEGQGELVLIDQHAAHERVAFSRLKQRYRDRSIAVQRLLFPRQIAIDEVSGDVAAVAGQHLAALGFEVEHFGGTSWAIKSVPVDLREGDIDEVVRQLFADLAEKSGSQVIEERIDHVLATIACHSVVRAGDPIGEREAVALLSSLDDIEFRGFCPHGRPVLLRMRVDEIARRFGRT